MADELHDRARIEQLAAGISAQVAPLAAVLAEKSSLPLFVRHSDGSIWTRDGKEIKAAPEPAPAKENKP